MNNVLTLQRIGYADTFTIGTLKYNDLTFATIERPWLDNKRNVSCIPEGTYPLKWRHSNTITRITQGEHTHGYEISDVPGRSHILFHPGNFSSDVEGCVAVGMGFTVLLGQVAISQSQIAYNRLIKALGMDTKGLQVRVEHFCPKEGCKHQNM